MFTAICPQHLSNLDITGDIAGQVTTEVTAEVAAEVAAAEVAAEVAAAEVTAEVQVCSCKTVSCWNVLLSCVQGSLKVL